VNASFLAASSADAQVSRSSKLPHFSHFLISAIGSPPAGRVNLNRSQLRPTSA
jgi:hypothetical protein